VTTTSLTVTSSERRTQPCPLTCVIVTFNSAPWISRSLRALLASAVTGLEIVVVDNASTDDTLTRACEYSELVEIVALDENIGFSRACNLAARRASGEFLLFLNPDTELRPDAATRAMEHLRARPDVGIVGGRTSYLDGSPNPTCCFREPSLWSAFCSASGLSSLFRRSSLFNPEHMGGWDRNDDRDVDVVTGCFLMIRRSLFWDLGGFDERFFLYSEDTDLCRRVRDRGLTCVHLAGVQLVHAGGASEPERADKVAKVMRAKSQYYRKHWGPVRARAGVVLLDATVLSRLAAHELRGDQAGRDRWRDVWHRRSEWRRPGGGPAPDSGALDLTKQLAPRVPLEPRRVSHRGRMAYRWSRHLARSVRSRDYDFALQAADSLARLPTLIVSDLVNDPRRRCNVCNWSGPQFYPNTGPGYHEPATTCPGCGSLDRHRSLVALLASSTSCFEPGSRVVEVAPMRGFEALARRQPGVDYTSFDLARHAMERGDITSMRFDCDSVDYFVCFHVLEHIADEAAALSEIHRVLRPGGTALVQVPVDWGVAETYEYDAPDPREVGHVRRYGRDLAARLERHGFDVDAVRITDLLDRTTVEQFGLSDEPIFLAKKSCGAIG
jgi:GT2 family glycosyltransferase/SAM-dependent methyltransferase